MPGTNWQVCKPNQQSKQSLVQTSGVTVLVVPVWVTDRVLLFEFPLLFDPLDEEYLAVTN